MYEISTRADHRDQVRRILGQVPPVDDGVGAAGVQPTRNPYPTNSSVNAFIDDAVAWMSRKVKVTGDTRPRLWPVAASVAAGPFQIAIQQIAPTGVLNDVRRVAWLPDNQNEILLKHANREELDRTRMMLMTQPAATPRLYWVEFGTLSIWPAPQTAGTLSVMFSRALWSQSQDIDQEVIDVIPSDYWPLVDYKAAQMVCLQQPDDNVMQARLSFINAMIADTLPDFEAWARRQSWSWEASQVPETGRVGYYGGRR